VSSLPRPAGSQVATDPVVDADAANGDPADPWQASFNAAADAAVRLLQRQIPMTLWLVVTAGGTYQQVLTAVGLWSDRNTMQQVSQALPEFYARVHHHDGTLSARSVDDEDARTLVPGLTATRSFIGVPLTKGVNQPFGALCGFDSDPGSESFASAIELATFVGRMLSMVLEAQAVVAHQRDETDQARTQATTDELTGVLNRRGWQESLAYDQNRGRRPVSIMVLDLDDLKGTNDRDGHAAGDVRLQRLATVLSHACRPHDSVARIGGDEFAILARDCSAVAVQGVRARFEKALREASVAVSIGHATQRPDEELLTTWHRADMMMLRRKHPDTDR